MAQSKLTRRGLLVAGGATLGLAACGNGVGMNGASRLDARVDATRDYLFSTYPAVQPMAQNAQGVLYMPLMTEVGLGLGGAYGQGALRIRDATVDYYSATRASVGLQIGAQQYAHVLIFQSQDALAEFRGADGWVAQADAFYALPDRGVAMGVDSVTQQYPVVAMIFGQSGLMAGAAIAGTKYSRIIPSSF
ncbi:YSC84-related protein [Paracoccus pacificus]|uniref:YSC84-related protein n=1 Tax=Paracoccus pacificus TaxID=1463598 RepID=A0ABW4R3Y1_9RHOB